MQNGYSGQLCGESGIIGTKLLANGKQNKVPDLLTACRSSHDIPGWIAKAPSHSGCGEAKSTLYPWVRRPNRKSAEDKIIRMSASGHTTGKSKRYPTVTLSTPSSLLELDPSLKTEAWPVFAKGQVGKNKTFPQLLSPLQRQNALFQMHANAVITKREMPNRLASSREISHVRSPVHGPRDRCMCNNPGHLTIHFEKLNKESRAIAKGPCHSQSRVTPRSISFLPPFSWLIQGARLLSHTVGGHRPRDEGSHEQLYFARIASLLQNPSQDFCSYPHVNSGLLS